MRTSVLAALFALWAGVVHAAPAPINFTVGTCKIQIYTSKPLNMISAAITRGVIVVHGSNQDANNYYDRVWTAARQARAQAYTIVIAPRFGNTSGSGRCYWTRQGWKHGDQSRNSPSQSSFKALDRLVENITTSGRFPNLNKVVVTGHSAGAQFVNRYAAGTRTKEASGIRFVASNPSSWMYLTNERPLPGNTTEFAVPNTSCSSFNHYKYGLVGLNPYMQLAGVAQISTRYRTREVVYLLGTQDINPDGPGMDTTCPAQLQGPHRYYRGTAYFNYINFHYGDLPSHSKLTAPCGHSSSCIFSSPNGRVALFQ